ncbi:MAG: PD40 domain-containing protein [Bacteroidetes bacterium]|nr:PD40 domain-containing protein [Bacteroidota bacterium]
MFRSKAVIVFILFLTVQAGFSQYKNETDLKKQAEKSFEEEDYDTGGKLYGQLVANYPRDPIYNYRLGVCYLYNNENKKKCLPYLQLSAKTAKENEKEALFYLAKAYHINYRFDEAIKYYTDYKDIASATMIKKMQVDREIQACKNGKRLLSNLSELVVLENKELKQSDYFRSYDLQNVGGKLLIKPDEFVSSSDKKKKDKSIIYLPKNNERLFYASYGSGDNKDIYEVKKLPNGEWAKPKSIGAPVNTEFDEDYPFLHPNGKVLYFSSKGHNSMGGYDLFKSEWDPSNDKWKEPINLEFPINSPNDDILFVTDSLEKIAYFSTNRQSAWGKINVLKILTEKRPAEFAYIKGFVLKKEPNQSVQSRISVKNIETGDNVGIFSADEQGNYLLKLPNGGRFIFTVETPNMPTQSEGVNIPVAYTYKPYKQNLGYDNKKLTFTNYFDANGEDDYQNMISLIEEKAKMTVNASDFGVDPNNPVSNTAGTSTNNITQPITNNGQGATNNGQDTTNNGQGATNNGQNIGNNKPVNNKELVQMAYDDAKELQQNADSLKQDSKTAYTAANSKQEQARQKEQEYKKLLEKGKNETAPEAKQELQAQAEATKDDAALYTAQAATANNIAKQLAIDAENKQKEAELNLQYAKALEEAEKTKNNTKALAKLEALQKQLEEVSKQKSNSNALLESIKQDAENKEQELKTTESTLKQTTQDVDNITTSIKDLEKQINETKDKDLQENLKTQKQDQETDLADKQKELENIKNKITSLQEEAENLKSQADFAATIVNTPALENKEPNDASNERGASSNTQGVTNNTKGANNNTQGTGSSTQGVTNNTQNAINNTQSATNNTQRTNDNTQGVTNNTQNASNNTQSATNNTQSTNDNTQGVTNNTQSASNNTQRTNDNTQGATTNAQSANKDTQGITNNTQSTNKDTQGVTNNTQGTDNNTQDASNNKQQQAIDEQLQQADAITTQAKELRTQAKNLTGTEKQNAFNKISGLEQQATQLRYAATKQQLNMDNQFFVDNNKKINSLAANSNQGIQAKQLANEAATLNKEAQQLREEAEANGSMASKVGGLSNADEKQKEALAKQEQALKLLGETAAQNAINNTSNTSNNDTQDTSNNTQSVTNNTQSTNNNKRGAGNNTQGINTNTQSANNDTQGAGNNTQGVTNNTQNASNNTQSVTNNTQSTNDNTQGLTNNTQNASNNTQSATNNTQRTNDNTQGATTNAQSANKDTQDTGSNTQGITNNTQGTDNNTQGASNNKQQQAIDEQLQQADAITTQAKELRTQAKNLTGTEKQNTFNKISGLEQQATQLRYTATKQQLNMDNQFFVDNNKKINSLAANSNKGTQAKQLANEAATLNKEAQQLREEAEANGSMASKVGGLSNADEKQKEALAKQEQALKLLGETAAQNAINNTSNTNNNDTQDASNNTQNVTNNAENTTNNAQSTNNNKQGVGNNTQGANNNTQSANRDTQGTDNSTQGITTNAENATNNAQSKASSDAIKYLGTKGFEIENNNAYSAKKPIPINEKMPDGLVFRVQIGAFKNPIPTDAFRGLTPIGGETTPQGFIRYQAGMFDKYTSANAVKNDLRKLGYQDAFVVAYLNGKRIDLAAALANTPQNERVADATSSSAGITENSNIPTNTQIAESVQPVQTSALNTMNGLLLTVQIGVFTSNVSSAQLRHLKPIYREQLPNGNYRYTAGIYNNLDKVKTDRVKVNALGISDAFVSAYHNGIRIKTTEAIDKINNDKNIQFPKENPIVFPNENNIINTPINTPKETNNALPNNIQPFSNNATDPTPTAENGVKTDETGITFKVQIGAYRKQVPQDVADTWLQVKTWSIKNNLVNDLYLYTVGSFSEARFAQKLKEEIVALGIKDAFVTVFKDGKKLYGAEAQQYFNR